MPNAAAGNKKNVDAQGFRLTTVHYRFMFRASEMEINMTATQLTDEQIEELDAELTRIKVQLAGFRSQIINGFVNKADERLCERLCLRWTRIKIMLNEDEE
jgi:hypothetical protein